MEKMSPKKKGSDCEEKEKHKVAKSNLNFK